MNKYLLPLKREVWEHQGSFIKMPMIVVAVLSTLLLLMAFMAGDSLSNNAFFNYEFSGFSVDGEQTELRSFQYSDKVIGEAKSVSAFNIDNDHDLRHGLKITAQSPFVLFNGLMMLAAVSYLLSCLIADRKDGSILFWKSMPVSETQNVINKVLIATFFIPAVAWAASLVMSIVVFILSYGLASWSGMNGLPSMLWQESSIIETSIGYIGTYLSVTLWLLPITAWLLFASATTKKNAFLTATLPIVIAVIVEKYMLGSHHLAKTFFQHFAGLINGQEMPFMILNPEGWSQLGSVLSSTQFWLAVPISGALTYGAIWMRENRYESN